MAEQAPGQASAQESWSLLDDAWRAAIGMAWESYRQGGVAVGAVVTDEAGVVIGEGRNQRFSSISPRGLLAHAELEALAGVPERRDRTGRIVLSTTLHPCPMCLGALVIARVDRVRFGAYDPTWLGIERLPDLNDEVQRRWPEVSGPVPGPLGEWLAVLPCLNTSGSLVRAMKATAPRRAELARAVARRLTDATELPDAADQALDLVWDLLIGALES